MLPFILPNVSPSHYLIALMSKRKVFKFTNVSRRSRHLQTNFEAIIVDIKRFKSLLAIQKSIETSNSHFPIENFRVEPI